MLAQDSVGDVSRLDRRETASGMDAAWLTRFGATAFISRCRKQQRQGWQLFDWLQQEAMYPALCSSKQEANYVAVVHCLPMAALYCPKLAATYTGAAFVMPSRQQGCAVVLIPRAGSNLCRRNSRSRDFF